jgi:hypothetical protein
MERLHAPNEFFRIRRLREGMRPWEELSDFLALARSEQLPALHPDHQASAVNPARSSRHIQSAEAFINS